MHTRSWALKVKIVDGFRGTPKMVNPWFIMAIKSVSWIEFRCRWGQAESGVKISISICFAATMIICILGSCQDFQSGLCTLNMLANLGEMFECSMVRIDLKGYVQ